MIKFPKEVLPKYLSRAAEIIKSGQLSEGTYVSQLESAFSEVIGSDLPGCVVSSGGEALRLLLDSVKALRFKEGTNPSIVVPSNTFEASSYAAIKAGYQVIIADVNPDHLCIGLDNVKDVFNHCPYQVLLVVHIGGHIDPEIEEIAKYCDEKGIILLEDCAHAHAATLNGKHAGLFGLGSAFSFYGTKTLGGGEGGMLISGDEDLLTYARRLRTYDRDDHKIVCMNSRMSELNAAFILTVLEHLSDIVENKRHLASKLDRILPHYVLPASTAGGYYKYLVDTFKLDRELVKQTGKVYEIGLHQMSSIGKTCDLLPRCTYPGTREVSRRWICAPIFYEYSPYLTNELADIERFLFEVPDV